MILMLGSFITAKQRKTTIETISYHFKYFLNAVDGFKLSGPDEKHCSVSEISVIHQLLILISHKSQRMGKVPGNGKQSVAPIFTEDKRSKLSACWPSFSTELSELK